MLSNHLILSCPLPFGFSLSQHQVFCSELTICIRWPKDWSFHQASALPMNIQSWFPLGLTGWSLLSKGLSRVFSNTNVLMILYLNDSFLSTHHWTMVSLFFFFTHLTVGWVVSFVCPKKSHSWHNLTSSNSLGITFHRYSFPTELPNKIFWDSASFHESYFWSFNIMILLLGNITSSWYQEVYVRFLFPFICCPTFISTGLVGIIIMNLGMASFLFFFGGGLV